MKVIRLNKIDSNFIFGETWNSLPISTTILIIFLTDSHKNKEVIFLKKLPLSYSSERK